jgi:hypothetical protein
MMTYKKYNNAKKLAMCRKNNRDYIVSFDIVSAPLTYYTNEGVRKALTRSMRIV